MMSHCNDNDTKEWVTDVTAPKDRPDEFVYIAYKPFMLPLNFSLLW